MQYGVPAAGALVVPAKPRQNFRGGLCPQCEEEIETTEHALLRCPARQYARGSFPEALDLKSAWYDTTATEMLAKFARRTLTTYPPEFTPLSLIAWLPGFGAC